MVVGLVVLPLVGGGILVAAAMPEWMKQRQVQAAMPEAPVARRRRIGSWIQGNPPNQLDRSIQAAGDSIAAHARLDSLGRYVESRRANGQQLPRDDEALYALHRAELDRDAPVDPFDGKRFGYEMDADGDTYVLWSAGPDGRSGTEDDLDWRPSQGSPRDARLGDPRHGHGENGPWPDPAAPP
jgi:hypothetical protein